ncbi:MAG: glycosyltransferase family 2 protein [Elusimicrobiota bacterium]|jgi:glycosyltransferase involved in cell wall biosynthesis|nr:glycosyltransferase family 2 protein [Elusimicrobiota bacterium]
MFSINDIQIFVITRNRPEMLKQALHSVLNQYACGSEIYVLDNSTDDTTQKTMIDYPKIRYIKTDPLLPFANFLTAQSLMAMPYSMILHDDDLIHPDYISLALKILNSVKDITYIGCKNTTFYDNNIPDEYKNPTRLSEEFFIIDNPDDFTLGFWSKINSNWSCSIIKSSIYKQADMPADYKLYGKVNDLAMLSQIMSNGKGNAVITKDKRALFYRNHVLSDRFNEKTALTRQQLTNYISLFYKRSRSNKYLRRIYFLYVIDNIKDNFIPKITDTDINSFLISLKEKGLLSAAILLYNKRKENLLIRLFFLPVQFIYKRNYYKKFLRKL